MRLTSLQIRRNVCLPGAGDAENLPPLGWPFACGRPSHAAANLRGVHVELRKGAAERVAVHAEFFRGLALVSLMLGQDFKDVPPLELSHRLVIGDACTVHL